MQITQSVHRVQAFHTANRRKSALVLIDRWYGRTGKIVLPEIDPVRFAIGPLEIFKHGGMSFQVKASVFKGKYRIDPGVPNEYCHLLRPKTT